MGSDGQQLRRETDTHPWGNTTNHWQGFVGKDVVSSNSLLPGIHEAEPGVQCPVLFSWEWETGESSRMPPRLQVWDWSMWYVHTRVWFVQIHTGTEATWLGLQLRGWLASVCSLLYLMGSYGEKEENLFSQERGMHTKVNHCNWKQHQDGFKLEGNSNYGEII